MELGNLLCYNNAKLSSAKLHLVNPFLHTSKWSFSFADHVLTLASSTVKLAAVRLLRYCSHIF